jgi:hypothetical protein
MLCSLSYLQHRLINIQEWHLLVWLNKPEGPVESSVTHTIHGTYFCCLSTYVSFEFVLARHYTFIICGPHIETKQVQLIKHLSSVQEVPCKCSGFLSVVNEVSFLLQCGSASLDIWLPTFRNVRNLRPSDAESHSRTDTAGGAFVKYQSGWLLFDTCLIG